MALQCCRVHFTHSIKYNLRDISAFALHSKIYIAFTLVYFLSMEIYALEVMSDGKLPREVYKIIDKLDVF